MGIGNRRVVYILLFCLSIFTLVSLSFMTYHLGNMALSFYSTVIYPVVFLLIYICLVDPMRREFKIKGRRIILLTFSVSLISALVIQLIWIAVAPNWVFKIMTDKTNYRQGETVEITVILENCGFITHSFTSLVSDPIIVSIWYIHPENPTVKTQVWYTPYNMGKTKFVLAPHQFLERKLSWNQTNIYDSTKIVEPGTYLIEALIPSSESEIIGTNNLFYAWTMINITTI